MTMGARAVKTDEDRADADSPWSSLVLIWIVLAAAWLALGVVASKQVRPGEFGDMFGAVNALFSGLAFGTLIYTLFLQRRELALQRLELRATRQELAGQREQLEAQNDQMRRDAFESSFFRVLAMLAEIVESIDLVGDNPAKGRDCFRRFYERFESAYKRLQLIGRISDDRAAASKAYGDFYSRYQGDVGHYFRTLYNLVKLVDRSNVDDKHFYTNLIRAQLSNQETLLLFYNCAGGLGQEKFKPLIERYALLKNMPRERLLSPDHEGWFADGAYGAEYKAKR